MTLEAMQHDGNPQVMLDKRLLQRGAHWPLVRNRLMFSVVAALPACRYAIGTDRGAQLTCAVLAAASVSCFASVFQHAAREGAQTMMI